MFSLNTSNGLGYASIILVAIINVAGTYFFFKSHLIPQYSYVGSDFPERFEVSNWRPAKLTVEDSVHYQPTSPYANKEWLSMIPEGEGFVRYFNGKHDRAFGLSIYHQLHCMNQLRRATYQPVPNLEHLHHCLNYIRQLTLCSPDLHLEPVVLQGDSETQSMVGVNGLGVTHTCKDWSALFDAVEQHHHAWMRSKQEGPKPE